MELTVTFSSSLKDEVMLVVNKSPLNTIIRHANNNEDELVVHVAESEFHEMNDIFFAMVSMLKAAEDMAGMIEKLWSSAESSSLRTHLGTLCESSNESTTE